MTTWKQIANKKERSVVPLGTFWSGSWDAPEDKLYARTIGRDRLELLRTSDYTINKINRNSNLYDLAKDVLMDAGLQETDYWIDEELQEYEVPYPFFDIQSHREALRKIAEAAIGQVYCDREGIIRIEGASYLENKANVDIEITKDDYFKKNNPAKDEEIANYIEVETQPLSPDVNQEVYHSTDTINLIAGQARTMTVNYNHTPCIEAVANLTEVTGSVTIQGAEYYAWGADITLYSVDNASCKIKIDAKPLIVLSKYRVIARDEASIIDNGIKKFTFPANSLVQTEEVAQKIADKLLLYYKDPRRDIEMSWRGNPALELGDVIETIDYETEKGRYHVTKQELEYNGALRARLEGRRAK